MKFGWALVWVAAVGFGWTMQARGQASVYVQGTATNMPGGPGGSYLYGGQGGVLYDGPTFKSHILLSANIQGGYVTNAGERLVTAELGPRVSFPLHKLKLAPYGEFLVGFGRYRDSSSAKSVNTTDYDFQAGGGVAKQITPRLDVTVSANYGVYGASFPSTVPALAAIGVEFQKYNPINYNLGVVYHFVKR